MDSSKSTKSFMHFFLLLLMIMSSLSMECPPRCHCSPREVLCRDAGLKELPKDIPSTVEEINLSDMPLLPIAKDSFMKFPKLRLLVLKNVSQRGPIHLPKSLTRFVFRHNLISIDPLKEMLRSPLNLLRVLELQDNNLKLHDLLPILPKGIKHLILSGNKLETLKRGAMDCCKELTEFICEHCSLKFIEPNAFDMTRKLTIIKLSVNGLVDLPERLFERLPRLRVLQLRGNHFEFFNTGRVGLKRLQYLGLGHNRLRSVDLQYTNILSLEIENNEIRRIDRNMFRNSRYMNQVSLRNNRITEIPQLAFQNTKYLKALFLQGNKINRLPGRLFNSTHINTLCLHNNSLSNVDALVLGMMRTPNLLTLFSNKKMEDLDLSIFVGMDERSRVLISCKDLKRFTLSSKVRTSIKCCPSTDLVITTPFRFLMFDGYQCNWNTTHLHFVCHACSVGFFLDGRFKCVPCPPGSFYQDEMASLSCKACPIGQYVSPVKSPGKDVSDCRTCPQGTNTTQSAGTRACYCLKGFHRSYRFGPCQKCEQRGFDCMRDYPQLRRGFWMTWTGTGSSTNHTTCKYDFQEFMFNLETHNNKYHRQTMKFNCQLPIPIKCPRHDACLGGIESNCSAGHTGILCAACQRGFTHLFNRCIKCLQPYIVVLELIACIALFILLCYIFSEKSGDTGRKNWRGRQNYAYTHDRTFADMIISSFKIMIGFYQTLIGVVHALSHINWPSNFLKMFSILEYIPFELVRIQSLCCLNPVWKMGSIEEFWIVMITAFTFPILCLVCFLAASCYLDFNNAIGLQLQRKKSLYAINFMKIVALFLFITYPLISTRIIRVLPISCRSICTAKRNGVCLHSLSFLRSDYSVPCPSMSSNKYTLIFAYCCLIIAFGLPCALWTILKKYFTKKHNSSVPYVPAMETITRDEADEGNVRQRGSVNANISNCLAMQDSSVDIPCDLGFALKFTHENYKEKYWFWEVIEMIRKLIMTAGATFFLYETKIGLSSLVILGMAFAILHAVHKPMINGFENLLQMLSLFIVTINLSVAAVIQSSIADSNESTQKQESEPWKLGLFLIILNSLIVILMIGRLVKVALERTIAGLV